MGTIIKYARIYRGFINTCISQATSFRLHFFLLIFMDLFFYISSLATVDFIFDYVPMIGPWNRDQFLFFISFMLAIDQLHMTFVSEGFWSFSFELRTGHLDFHLLRPAGTIFSVFFRHIRAGSLLLIFVPWACLIWFGMKIPLDPFAWVLLPCFVIAGLILLVSFELFMTMFVFWTIEVYGINFLRIQFQQLSRWPAFAFKPWPRRIFTFVLPILLIGTPTTGVLLGTSPWYALLYMLAATLILWGLVRWLWLTGLKSYESASS